MNLIHPREYISKIMDFNNIFLRDLDDQKYTDCEFTFGDGESVAAHKLSLACASPVFNRMFYGLIREISPIHIPDIPMSVFRKLIE